MAPKEEVLDCKVLLTIGRMTEGGCVDTVASVREVVVLGQLLPRIIGGDLPSRCDNHAVVGNMTNDGSNWLAWIASGIPCKLRKA